jgi:hypothetical protein
MNCKPGDLAIITRNPHEGRMVEVLYAAPVCDHVLPCGKNHLGSGPESWVVRSLGSPFILRQYTAGVLSMTTNYYAVCYDKYMKPLPGKLEETEEANERELAH